MSHTGTWTVAGMTCEHCVASVSEELGDLAGVTAVRVDLPTGRVEVDSDDALTADQVRAAVQEAGYQLA